MEIKQLNVANISNIFIIKILKYQGLLFFQRIKKNKLI